MGRGSDSVKDSRLLIGRTVALSISESPDMAVLGLGREHLTDAMTEIARHLLAQGAHLIYGGDLRTGGFTEVLLELVARHRRASESANDRVGATNVLAWPIHVSLSRRELKQLSEDFGDSVALTLMTPDGQLTSPDDHGLHSPRTPTDDEWAPGLTSMRTETTRLADARVVLGGQVDGYRGRMPGVAEEVLLTLQARKPVFLLGGFGGCALDISEKLGLAKKRFVRERHWANQEIFGHYGSDHLNNGLNRDENEALATTAFVDEAGALIIRGLFRLKDGA